MNRRTSIGLLAILALLALQGTAASPLGLGADGFQGTTYILSRSEAEVIITANGTSFDLTIPYKTDLLLFDSLGNEVPVETAVEFWRGSYTYHISSHRPVRGYINYNRPILEQRLVAPVEVGESVRVVLPEGYATGDMILGRARPGPDEVGTLGGRTALFWAGPEKRTYIDVSFYKEGAPRAFRLFLLLLAFIAGVLVLEHNMSIKRLRSFREDAEIDGDEPGYSDKDRSEKDLSDKDRADKDHADKDLSDEDLDDKDRADKDRGGEGRI
ncbi:MAG: conserved exported protein of unknown function [Methanothrix sp.]|jgi:hypothetical protein|nr:MAG: conserved exported protein of unknown function [Methanothrix sp.]